jgi:hypothetical protein
LVGVPIDSYALAFVIAGPEGEVAVERSFSEAADGAALVTDGDGRFEVTSDDLGLSYDWETEELVCNDVCVDWETYCDDVTEEVCDSVCTDVECFDECSTECWDETVCDEFGDCWVESYCEDVCMTVCEEVSYDCDCYIETYEVCGDECVESTQECGYVTHLHSTPAALSDVVAAYAHIVLDDGAGGEQWVSGFNLEARQHAGCDRDGNCGPVNLWIQKDRFDVPDP